MEQSDRDQDLLIADLDQENRRLRTALAQARSDAIEEVARAIEEFKYAFGGDTVASFTAFVRGMK